MVQSESASVFASSLNVGDSRSPLSYTASYALNPGGLFDAEALSQLSQPQGLGEQRIAHNARLRSPVLAGAPLSLGYSRTAADRWTMNGVSESQRQVADLSWSPRLASVNLRWAGPNAGIDNTNAALDCGLSGDVRVPLWQAASDRSRALRVSGRSCAVAASQKPRYSDLQAHAMGLAYSWQEASRESSLRLSTIDPSWGGEMEHPTIAPSYEVGFSRTHRVHRWSATGQAALRRAASRTAVAESGVDTHVTTTASVTRELPTFSVSANWTHGDDPLWFMPDVGEQANRFGVALNFSRWAQTFAPQLNPNLALNWHWNEARARDDTVLRSNALRLNMSVMW